MIPLTQYELARQLYLHDSDCVGAHGPDFTSAPERVQDACVQQAGKIIENLAKVGIHLEVD